jgi:hypothetical protein
MLQRILITVLIYFSFIGYSNAGSTIGQATFDSLALTRQLSQEAERVYAKRMANLIEERKRLSLSRDANGEMPPDHLDRIAEINRQLKELSEKRSTVLKSDLTWKAFESVRVMYQTLHHVENSMNQVDTWSSDAAWMDEATGGLLARYHRDLQVANEGIDYGKRLLSLQALIQKLDQKAPTPAFKKMRDGLNGLFWLMKTFGDKSGLPGISDFMQQYGDAGTAMIGASERIYRRILDREDNQLLPGRHGDDGRYNAFEKQFPRLADRMDIVKPQIPGLPDVYESGDGGVLIWDRQYKIWYRTHPNDPQKTSLPNITNLGPDAAMLSPEQVLQRYIFLKQNGDQTPSPLTVLADPTRVVALSLRSDREVVEPGGKIQLNLTAMTMSGDQRPIVLAKLRAKPKANISETMISSRYGIIEPSLIDLSEPEKAVWRAPNNSNTVFELSATLSGDNDDSGLIQVGKAVIEVATGNPSQLKIRVEPVVCQTLGDGQVYFSLLDSNGNPIAAAKGKTADELIVINGSDGLLVESPRWIEKDSGKGWAAWHAPNAPGEYYLNAYFRGFSEFGVLSSRAVLGSKQVATVTVVRDGKSDGDETDPQALISKCGLSIDNFSVAPTVPASKDEALSVTANVGYNLVVPIKGRAIVSISMDGIEQVRKIRDLEPGNSSFNDDITLEIPAKKVAGNHQVALAVSIELEKDGMILKGPSDSRDVNFTIDLTEEIEKKGIAGVWEGKVITDVIYFEEQLKNHRELKLTLNINEDEKSGHMVYLMTVDSIHKLAPDADASSFRSSAGEKWDYPVSISRSGNSITIIEIDEEDPDLASTYKLTLDAPNHMSASARDKSELSEQTYSVVFQKQ